ncbi:unnamed protein product [Cylindrotheca closterium]|uniref:Uncharacterized protein n=1 Tax=Cylindrotheca closterium TaxID=2856 RepID=A0AAD2CSR3_9STRA|nr:unnamed protein product [Cylindrotheca closterium]
MAPPKNTTKNACMLVAEASKTKQPKEEQDEVACSRDELEGSPHSGDDSSLRREARSRIRRNREGAKVKEKAWALKSHRSPNRSSTRDGSLRQAKETSNTFSSKQVAYKDSSY